MSEGCTRRWDVSIALRSLLGFIGPHDLSSIHDILIQITVFHDVIPCYTLGFDGGSGLCLVPYDTGRTVD